MASPYDWRYTLRRPYYQLRPSLKNHTGLRPRPGRLGPAHVPSTGGVRVLFVGDIMPLTVERVPAVDPGLRALL